METQTDDDLTLLWQLSALADRPPETPDALHAYIKGFFGFHIPRVAVCPDHQAPFDFMADAFFQKYERFLVLASRGSGKTRALSILNLLHSKFHPRVGTIHFGAVGAQAGWGFGYLRDMLRPQYLHKDIVREVANHVAWSNGSWVTTSSGHAITGVTAIRGHRLILDEVDLWDPDHYETAQQMVTGTKHIKSQRIAVSTEYNAYGLMSTLWSQRLSRKTQGYKWCCWECLEPCTICRGEKCPFYVWENPRTGKVEPLCKGRALKSDGFIPLEAAIDEYYATDAETFAVQKLLMAPERRSLIYPTWSPETHCQKTPRGITQHAHIGIGVDWGFDHPLVFTVYAQVPNGRIYGLAELGERFAPPDREVEIAQDLNEQYKIQDGVDFKGEPVYRYPTFFTGLDQPKSAAAFVEVGLAVCPNQVRFREEGHRAIRKLLDRNKGPLLHIDPDKMPMTVYQLGRLHKDDKGREVLKDNDFADSSRHVLATAVELGGISPGGHLMI